MLEILAVLAMQSAPVAAQVRRVPVVPRPRATMVLADRKQRLVADGRAALVQAQQRRVGYVPKAGQPSKAELETVQGQLKSELDSMSEMGEMESLRLQMAMDRVAKLMATLSNIMKKMSDTDQGIIQNLK